MTSEPPAATGAELGPVTRPIVLGTAIATVVGAVFGAVTLLFGLDGNPAGIALLGLAYGGFFGALVGLGVSTLSTIAFHVAGRLGLPARGLATGLAATAAGATLYVLFHETRGLDVVISVVAAAVAGAGAWRLLGPGVRDVPG